MSRKDELLNEMRVFAGVPIKANPLTEKQQTSRSLSNCINAAILLLDDEMLDTPSRELKTIYNEAASDLEDILSFIKSGKNKKAIEMYSKINSKAMSLIKSKMDSAKFQRVENYITQITEDLDVDVDADSMNDMPPEEDATVWNKTDDKNEITDQYPVDSDLIKFPKELEKELVDAIITLQADAEKNYTIDYNTARNQHTCANAFMDILNFLKSETESGMKYAQIHTTKLMSPMLHKMPKNVLEYITKGGGSTEPNTNNSLTSIYKDLED